MQVKVKEMNINKITEKKIKSPKWKHKPNKNISKRRNFNENIREEERTLNKLQSKAQKLTR